MSQSELSVLERRILFRCQKSLLGKSYLSQLYVRYSKIERDAAIKQLIKQRLILAKEMPKPNTTRTPIFFEITKKGKQWVAEYMANYPEQ